MGRGSSCEYAATLIPAIVNSVSFVGTTLNHPAYDHSVCQGQSRIMTNSTPRQVRNHGRVVRPGLGVTLLSDKLTTSKIGPDAGVIIRDVLPGPQSGAARARLRWVFHTWDLSVEGGRLRM
jgi:hypothetical protein